MSDCNSMNLMYLQGTVHGFGARPQNEVEEKARQEAIPVAIEFLTKHAAIGVHRKSNL